MATKKTGSKGGPAKKPMKPAELIGAIDQTLRAVYPKSYAKLGAPDPALLDRLRAEAPHAPDILLQLYAWKNGGESFLTLVAGDSGASDWMPLAKVFSEKARLSELGLPVAWLPIFESTDGAYHCIAENGALAYFDTLEGDSHVGYDTGAEVVDRLERALEVTHANMLSEHWMLGREAKDTAGEDKIVGDKKKKVLAIVDKAAKGSSMADWTKVVETTRDLLLVHQRPDVVREIVTAAAPRLPRGGPGARIRGGLAGVDAKACVALELEAEAVDAAGRAFEASGDGSALVQVAHWLFQKGAFALAAESLGRAAKQRPDPFLVGHACALAQAGDVGAARAASDALAAIDKTLATLTAPHHGTARGAALVRKAVVLSLRGDKDEARDTLRRADAEAPSPGALDAFKSDPLWAAIVHELG